MDLTTEFARPGLVVAMNDDAILVIVVDIAIAARARIRARVIFALNGFLEPCEIMNQISQLYTQTARQ